MATKPEAKLWQILKAATSHRIDWDRIENSVGNGIPDLIGSAVYRLDANALKSDDDKGTGIPLHGCRDFYLELKVSSTETLKPIRLWKPTQVAWQTRASRRGRPVFNLIHLPSASFCIYNGQRLLDLMTRGPAEVPPDYSSSNINELIDYIVTQLKNLR